MSHTHYTINACMLQIFVITHLRVAMGNGMFLQLREEKKPNDKLVQSSMSQCFSLKCILV